MLTIFLPQKVVKMNKTINLSAAISPAFFYIHRDVFAQKHTHYWLKGGRGSGKSSFISIEIILGIMKDESANAVVLRKIGKNLRNSVFEQLRWAADTLGVSDKWDFTVSPMEMVYLKTGQKIIFRGADDPRKIKSVKVGKGYIKFIWFEEADEFDGMEEIRSINQSLMRGGNHFCVFYSYNPPQSIKNWINLEADFEREDKLIHCSTYLDMPEHWLGRPFFIEAEHLKNTYFEKYAHEYLGEVTGTGGEVFKNVSVRTISDEEIAGFDRISRGLDWGFASDPLHYTVNHFDKTRRKLYIFFEIHKRELSNFRAASLIKAENIFNDPVFCDSAEPKSIAEFKSFGVRAVPAKKGPDSIYFGIKWLQDLDEIIIDGKRCPNTAREFIGYELKKDIFGNFKAAFPDEDNHSIDAVRYSREEDMRKVKVM